MKCDVIRDLMPLYIDECLSEASIELVEEHLENCEECRKYLEKMRWEFKIDDEDIKKNISEEMLLKAGKNVIKKEIQWDYEIRFAIIDLIVNIVLLISVIKFVSIWGWNRIISAPLDLLFGFFACTFVSLLAEITFLVNRWRGKEPVASRIICIGAIGLKFLMIVMLIFIGVIAVFTGYDLRLFY